MASRSRLFSKIAKDVGSDGNLSAAALSPDVSFGATVYDSTGLLPYVGNDTGDQAYVKSNNRFYIWDSAGWYNVALINKAPNIASVLDSDGGTSPFALAIDGTVTTITITAADSDGDPITYSATSDSGFSGLATLSQTSNVFTITPLSQDSATTTSGTITFTATDGVNIASSGVQTFTLSFLSPLWDETVLSIGTSSTNGLDNSTFIDRSTNAHTVTTSGSPVQTAFHPYHDNWSWEFGNFSAVNYTNSSDLAMGFGTDDFTIEFWVKFANSDNCVLADWRSSAQGNFATIYHYNGVFSYYRNGSFQITTTVSPNIGQWYHIAVCRSSNVTKMFIDGVQSGGDLADTTNYYVGATDRPIIGMSGYNNLPFLGLISNFRTIRGTGLYTSNFTPPTEKLTAVYNTRSLVAHTYRFYNEYSAQQNFTPGLNILNTVKVVPDNPFGIAEYAVGANKGSVYLNGSSSVDGGASINPSSGCCIEGWAYVTSVSSFAFFFSTEQGNSGFYPRWYVGHDNSGNWRVSPGDATDNNLTSYPLVKNQWNHWALTNDGSTSRLFVNGKLIYTKSVTPTSESLNINISKYGDSLQYTTYGYISDFRAATTIPTAYQTSSTTLDTQVFTPPSSPGGISGAGYYLPMDNAGIFDKTGNNTLTLAGNTVTSTTQTKFADTAVYFDGTGDYMIVDPGKDWSFAGDFTWEVWVYPTAHDGGSTDVIMSNYQGSTIGITFGIFSTTGKFYFAVGGDNNQINDTGSLPLNTWTHLAGVRSGSTVTFYVNGTSVGTTTKSGTLASTSDLTVGTNVGGGALNFNGYIENLQILNGVAKYTTNFTPPTSTQGRNYQAES